MRTRGLVGMFVVLAAATALAACSTLNDVRVGGEQVIGSGAVSTDVRTVGEVSRVQVGHGIRVHVVIGTPTSVRLEAQENLLPITTTTTSGDRLTIGTTRNYTTDRGILATVTVPRLDEIGLEGGATGQAFGLTAGNLIVNAEGGASLALTGTSDALQLRGEGGAVLDLGGLTTRTAAVDLDGGVVLKLAATQSVTGTADGGAVIHVRGTPATVDVRANGGSVVIRD